MIVKIYWANGTTIDSHMIPDWTGETLTHLDEKTARDRSVCEADSVAEIVERVRASEEGVFLERYKRVRVPGDAWMEKGSLSTNGTQGMCIVFPEDMPRVERVTVDDEQIWPVPEENDLASEVLESLRQAIG